MVTQTPKSHGLPDRVRAPASIHIQAKATAIGATAIVLWSSQALLTTLSGNVPPFQLIAMCFAVGGLIGLIIQSRDGNPFVHWVQPWPVWALGVAGLFGYHSLYFLGLRNAPAVEASLFAYLWPLLIVIFAAFLPGGQLRPLHVGGAILGFSGVALLVTGGPDTSLDATHLFGLGCALASAVVWAIYSVLSRMFRDVPSQIVTAFCLATSCLSLIAHLLFETTIWPQTLTQWLAIIALGLGPLGLAFTVWDIGMKKGNISLLGIASYAAPLLSTLLLVAFKVTPPTSMLAASAALITLGAVVASLAGARQAKASCATSDTNLS
jgi:drug/metabolite transporter (DMT)-like permease